MKTYPPVPDAFTVDVVRQAWGLPVERILFTTTGWASYHYKAETAAGESYWVKLYDESLPAPLLATSRDFYLPASYQLCTRGLLPRVACPVPARDGRFWAREGHYVLVVFDYIDGKTVGYGPLPDDVVTRLAGPVGRLHACTAELDLPHPMVEDFRIAFQETMPAGLDALAALDPAGRPGRRGFQELLLPRRGDIERFLARLQELQAAMRAQDRERVLCHTDLHGGNLMVDRQGDLYLVDWEGAMLAPPEQDLFFFAGEDNFWDLFWPGYRREFDRAGLDLDALRFYYYRRGLEDMAEWIERLLHPEQDDRADLSALHWATVTMEDLAGAEAKVAGIAGAYRRYVTG